MPHTFPFYTIFLSSITSLCSVKRISKFPVGNYLRNDGDIEFEKRPAVRIGKQIWMRHNLEANISVDADALPMTINRQGNYYQFGANLITGTATATMQNSNRKGVNPSPTPNPWNATTADSPKKGSKDPCQ